jgi:hypothetical protein
VARRSCVLAGKQENAQVGVFLAYASEKGAAFVDQGAVPVARVGWGYWAPSGDRCSRGRAVRDRGRAGEADAFFGIRCQPP